MFLAKLLLGRVLTMDRDECDEVEEAADTEGTESDTAAVDDAGEEETEAIPEDAGEEEGDALAGDGASGEEDVSSQYFIECDAIYAADIGKTSSIQKRSQLFYSLMNSISVDSLCLMIFPSSSKLYARLTRPVQRRGILSKRYIGG